MRGDARKRQTLARPLVSTAALEYVESWRGYTDNAVMLLTAANTLSLTDAAADALRDAAREHDQRAAAALMAAAAAVQQLDRLPGVDHPSPAVREACRMVCAVPPASCSGECR